MKDSISKIEKFSEKNGLGLIQTKPTRYVMKEGSTIVYIIIKEDHNEEWIVFYSIVVKGAKNSKKLMEELLILNAKFPFGAFGLHEGHIIFKHCILGGDHMDEYEFLQSLYSVAKIADEYDNKIIGTYGGKTAMDTLIEDLFSVDKEEKQK
jgi:hypothetical protein